MRGREKGSPLAEEESRLADRLNNWSWLFEIVGQILISILETVFKALV